MKAKAKEAIYQSASSIVDEVMLAEVIADSPSLPVPAHLIRTVNRVRQRLRPEDPIDLQFEVVNESHITFMSNSTCLSQNYGFVIIE